MRISTKAWLDYIRKMSAISEEAANKMQRWIQQNGFGDDQALLEYAFALSSHYGEAIGALACEMYEKTADAQGVTIAPAEIADTPEFGEVAKAVHGTMNESLNKVPATVGRLVKRTGADTTLKNAIRDGAEFAWVPYGDTCAFCIALASRGWQTASKQILKNGHAEHIHAHCDCQYAIRFDGKSGVKGYEPQKYLRMYYGADPNGNPSEKINALRRQLEEQKRQLSFDMSDYEKRTRVTAFTAFKAKDSRYGIYVSENANKKAQNLENVEKALDKAISKLGVVENERFPQIFILSQEEMGTNTFASYNAVRNELYLSDLNGNKRKTISVQKLMKYADPESHDSTIRHELIHWEDAEKYKKTGTIRNTEEYKQYLQHLREECKIILDKEGITPENVDLISKYAKEQYTRDKFDEVYTEYRVSKTGGKQSVHRK